MTRLERLYENYEDALFSLLMEDVAEAEGRSALEENERLKSDPSAALSKGLRRKLMGAIRRGFAVQDLRRAGRVSVKVIGKVAILVLVLVLSFSIAFTASADIREATADWIQRGVVGVRYKSHIRFSIANYGAGDQDSSKKGMINKVVVKVGWLPDDLDLFESSRSDNYIIRDYRNWEQTKQFVIYIAEFSEGGFFNIDSEDCQLLFMDIQGKSALASVKKQYCTIFMPMDEIGGVVTYSSEGLSLETVKKIVDTLTITIKE